MPKTDGHYGHLYDLARWKALRLAYLTENPICERCKANEIVEMAEIVHHRRAHRGDLDLFYDWNNLQALCKPHHDRDGQLEDHGKAIPIFGSDGWPI